jgi:hypothetical protein
MGKDQWLNRRSPANVEPQANRSQIMRIILSILIFYRKLIVPSLAVAMALGFLVFITTNKFPLTKVGIYYILMSLVFHYFIYEKRNPGEYYFYYNMGLSKFMLWGTTLLLSLVIALILLIVCLICR